jgi:hypothetical protein
VGGHHDCTYQGESSQNHLDDSHPSNEFCELGIHRTFEAEADIHSGKEFRVTKK